MDMTENVIVKRDKEVAVVTLNRPANFNAFDYDTISAFSSLLLTLAVDESVRGVVISGEGKAFCAGGDVKWMIECPDGPARGIHKLAASYHQSIIEIRRMPKPVIAAINGIAAGGGFSLALACDFRVMSRSAVLRQAYTSNGLCPDGGGMFTLPRLVGLARALEIVAFDAPISSEQAMKWGLVTRVVEDGQAMSEAVNIAHELAKTSLSSFAWSKQLLTDSFDSSLESHLEHERTGICNCADSREGKEGLKAFKEKRKPVYMP
jgi:2-(1,2-epoxy-1,2-dihydrophenyl)acetyl-CoA isomerase